MFDSYEETLKHIFGLHRLGMKLGLEPMRQALDKFGHPEKHFRIIHIAGTNGKGSVAAMVATILQEAGFKVGLFTSPHLITFRERIQVNKKLISKEDVVRLTQKINQCEVQLTFFETITAMAYLYFSEQDIDFAILETGIGGRLDSTNTVDAEINVITPIDFDHMEFLGNTIEEISGEKAAIIKKNATVVTSVSGVPLEVVKKKVKEMDATLIQAKLYDGELSLNGGFQKENAGIAFEVAKVLNIKKEIIKDALSKTFWPARCEFISNNLLIDCAHNLSGIKELTKFVKTQEYDRLLIVFGVRAKKNYTAMIKALPKPDLLIITKPRIQGALDPKLLETDDPCEIIEDPKEAVKYAQLMAKDNDLILVTGSCYLVGNILEPESEIKEIIPKAL